MSVHAITLRPEFRSAGAAAPAERRREMRHRIDGTAHLISSGGVHTVDLVDLSRGGALVSPPRSARIHRGDLFTVAGSAMPWERNARVVAISDAGLHLSFEAA